MKAWVHGTSFPDTVDCIKAANGESMPAADALSSNTVTARRLDAPADTEDAKKMEIYSCMKAWVHGTSFADTMDCIKAANGGSSNTISALQLGSQSSGSGASGNQNTNVNTNTGNGSIIA